MKGDRREYVALNDLAGTDGWPSRNRLFAFVAEHGIRRFKFPLDRKTYVRRTDLERARSFPVKRDR